MASVCSTLPPNFLNQDIFGQLLELEEDEPGFLKELVSTFTIQAKTTLTNLNKSLHEKSLEECSMLKLITSTNSPLFPFGKRKTFSLMVSILLCNLNTDRSPEPGF